MCRILEGLHVDLHPTHTTFAGGRGLALAYRNASNAVVAEEAGKAVWEGRQAGPSRVGWRAGWGGGQGQVEVLVGWLAGGDSLGWLAGGKRGMDLQSNECSRVNIVIKNLLRMFFCLFLIFEYNFPLHRKRACRHVCVLVQVLCRIEIS